MTDRKEVREVREAPRGRSTFDSLSSTSETTLELSSTVHSASDTLSHVLAVSSDQPTTVDSPAPPSTTEDGSSPDAIVTATASTSPRSLSLLVSTPQGDGENHSGSAGGRRSPLLLSGTARALDSPLLALSPDPGAVSTSSAVAGTHGNLSPRSMFQESVFHIEPLCKPASSATVPAHREREHTHSARKQERAERMRQRVLRRKQRRVACQARKVVRDETRAAKEAVTMTAAEARVASLGLSTPPTVTM
jgi:hypothetical protein